MDITKGEWSFEQSDLTIRSNDFKNGTQMGDYKGVIIADLKPALGCDYDGDGNVHLENTGRDHAIPQTLANAHLIAAAPDMYEALRELIVAVDEAIPIINREGIGFPANIALKAEKGRKALAKSGGEMIIVCAWCNPPRVIGTKPPYEDKRETSTICHDCRAKFITKAEDRRVTK